RQVALIRQAGLKWVPFLIIGPPYGFPDWWREDGRHVGLKCLEHGTEGWVESIWNPHWQGEVTRLLEAFADHYLPMDVIESVQPGICGDYGEAIFPCVGNWPGMYHTHPGYWCMDECALASFRAAMKDKYGDIAALNAAWRGQYGGFGDVRPMPRHKAPSRTAYFDFMMWYKRSMTEYDEFWMRECRRIFPDTPVYMCTGGSEEPWLGADFAEQARASARHGGGIRLTNETNTFSLNYYSTAHTVSACKHYGAYMGLEPVGPIIPKGVTTRMFGSAAYGNRQIFHYYGNLVGKDGSLAGAERALRYAPLIRERPIEARTAMFWPLDQAWVEAQPVSKDIALAMHAVRRQYEVWMLGETLVMDGALDRVNVLVMLGAQFTRRSVLEKIADWVANGGVLITDRRTADIEGEPVEAFDRALGFGPSSQFCGGLTTFYPNPQPWNSRFVEGDTCFSSGAWSDLLPGVVPLMQSKASTYRPGDNYQTITLELPCAFEHRHGKGRAIYYGGPLDLNPLPDQIFGACRAFEHLLMDASQAFSGIGPLGTQEGEIARARYDGDLLILTEDHIERR
ncbi:MAG: family 14 glycosylhydrolase, partial [Clostridiales bacterium]|nr:family 14 glycosylhydrolase [Clostridiales bacterium]